MIRFSQYITELFDAGVSFTKVPMSSSQMRIYRFETEEKTFAVQLTTAEKRDHSELHVVFTQELENGRASTHVLNNMGHKGSMQVFATVVTIVKSALKETGGKPWIMFDGTGSSRVKLYYSLARRICQVLNYRLSDNTNYDLKRFPNSVSFELIPN